MISEDIKDIGGQYKYGFKDDIEPIYTTGEGLSEEVVRNISKAKKLWFMNTEEDKDAYGISSNMFIEYVENLGVDLSNFTIVENLDAIESLREESNKHSITYKHLGNINGKNDPDCLYSVIAPYYEQI